MCLSPVKGKGLAMTLEQWVELVHCIIPVNTKIKSVRNPYVADYKHHLGGNKYVRVSTDFHCVDLRQFWLPENAREVVPTKRGIALNLLQWNKFKAAVKAVPLYVPEVLTTGQCVLRPDHVTQRSFWNCLNCNPNGDRLRDYIDECG